MTTAAEASAADQARDHDHREREQDRLVDAQQEHSPGERELHLAEQLPVGSAPIDVAASTVFSGTPRIPSAVIRTAGGIA